MKQIVAGGEKRRERKAMQSLSYLESSTREETRTPRGMFPRSVCSFLSLGFQKSGQTVV